MKEYDFTDIYRPTRHISTPYGIKKKKMFQAACILCKNVNAYNKRWCNVKLVGLYSEQVFGDDLLIKQY